MKSTSIGSTPKIESNLHEPCRKLVDCLAPKTSLEVAELAGGAVEEAGRTVAALSSNLVKNPRAFPRPRPSKYSRILVQSVLGPATSRFACIMRFPSQRIMRASLTHLSLVMFEACGASWVLGDNNMCSPFRLGARTSARFPQIWAYLLVSQKDVSVRLSDSIAAEGFVINCSGNSGSSAT